MPTDLKLDPITHDIDLTNGGEMFVDNPSVVGQRVKIAVLTRRGEWFRNTFEGLPYQQEFFKRKNIKPLIDQTMINYIGEVEGVSRIISYNSSIDVVQRVLNISVELETYSGDIIEVNVGEL